MVEGKKIVKILMPIRRRKEKKKRRRGKKYK